MMHSVHAGVHTNPVERHPKLSPYFDRHVSRGDLLSLAFGHVDIHVVERGRLVRRSAQTFEHDTTNCVCSLDIESRPDLSPGRALP
jgi:hypothetical protein